MEIRRSRERYTRRFLCQILFPSSFHGPTRNTWHTVNSCVTALYTELQQLAHWHSSYDIGIRNTAT
jgi:hypothetical protein